jgi:hypothetical protein
MNEVYLPIHRELEGFAFLQSKFRPKVLLAAVAARRLLALPSTAAPSKSQATSVLVPHRSHAADAAVIESFSLNKEQRKRISEAIDNIHFRRPDWRELMSIPIRIRIIRRPGVFSCSSMAYPQHVFLDETSFATSIILEEQLVHEYAHNWLYFLYEATIVTTAPDNFRFELYSGTGQRRVEEVFGAGHVVAALVRYYRSGPRTTHSEQRISYLLDYLMHAIEILDTLAKQGHLTEVGSWLVEQLQAGVLNDS